MHPAHPLPSRSDAATEAQTKGRQHPGERAAAPTENDTDTDQHGADAEPFRRQSLTLPCLADLGQKAAAWLGALGQNRVTTVAVVADCRRREQDTRPSLHRQGGDRADQYPRPLHS